MLGKRTRICQTRNTFQRSHTASWDVAIHVGCYVTEGELRICSNRNGSLGPRRQLLGRGFTVRKQCDPPQLGPMAAQAQYSLVSLNSSHMRREKWTSNLPWLCYSRVWQITFLSLRATLIHSPASHAVLKFSPLTSMCPVSVQRGLLHFTKTKKPGKTGDFV